MTGVVDPVVSNPVVSTVTAPLAPVTQPVTDTVTQVATPVVDTVTAPLPPAVGGLLGQSKRL